MSNYISENLRSYDGAIDGDVQITPHVAEASVSYAFGRVLEEDISEDEKSSKLEEVTLEGLGMGIDSERIKELYLEQLTGKKEE